MPKMRYIGKASIHGIPARDLSEREVERYGGAILLEATGLYEIIPDEKAVTKRHANKLWRGGDENKQGA